MPRSAERRPARRYETPSFFINSFRVRIGWPPYQGTAPPAEAANLTVPNIHDQIN
jgi:hypothetical protein